METDGGLSRFGDGGRAPQVRRQPGPGPRRHPGRLPVHGRLSDDARHFHPGLLLQGRFGTPHPFRAGRGRDRGDQHGPGGILRRRPVHGGHVRRRLRAHAGGGLPGGHDGNTRRHRRLPAARPGHGSSHKDRAGGSPLRPQRRSRRIPADHLRPRLHRGDDRPDQEEFRTRRPLPDSRFHSDGSVLCRFRPDPRGGDPAGCRRAGNTGNSTGPTSATN